MYLLANTEQWAKTLGKAHKHCCYIWVKCGTVLITEQQWTMKNLHFYFFHVLTHCWLLKYTIVQSTYVQSIERNINQDFSEWTLKHTLFTYLNFSKSQKRNNWDLTDHLLNSTSIYQLCDLSTTLKVCVHSCTNWSVQYWWWWSQSPHILTFEHSLFRNKRFMLDKLIKWDNLML